MAKVKLPLVSLEARGAIGKAIVYFPWKGINSVREYVIPANPKTPAQLTQRGYVTAAVLDWHVSDFTPDDADAWRLAASIVPKILTGPNTFVREHIFVSLAGKVWNRMREFKVDSYDATSIQVSVEATNIIDPPAFQAYLPIYYKVKEVAGSYHAASGRWVASIPGLTPKTLYFLKAYMSTATDKGMTGYYKQKTA